jgi:hypothetical protein
MWRRRILQCFLRELVSLWIWWMRKEVKYWFIALKAKAAVPL